MPSSTFDSTLQPNPNRPNPPSDEELERRAELERSDRQQALALDDDDDLEERARADRDQAERERIDRVRAQREQEPDGSEGSPESFGTSYLAEGKTDDAWRRWRELQGNFVDDPQRAVTEAHQLVSEIIDGIVQRFEQEREQLEHRWSSGEQVSTEDLRRCLQGYRDFFGRLLANVGDVRH